MRFKIVELNLSLSVGRSIRQAEVSASGGCCDEDLFALCYGYI